MISKTYIYISYKHISQSDLHRIGAHQCHSCNDTSCLQAAAILPTRQHSLMFCSYALHLLWQYQNIFLHMMLQHQHANACFPFVASLDFPSPRKMSLTQFCNPTARSKLRFRSLGSPKNNALPDPDVPNSHHWFLTQHFSVQISRAWCSAK